MKPQISITDGITGETIQRDMTDEELSQLEIDRSEAAAKLEAEEAEAEAKATAKAALLDRLGITAEEATLLLG
jgi:hypothetical protein